MINLGRFKGTVIEYRCSKAYGFIKVTHIMNNGVESDLKARYDDIFIYHKDIILPEGQTFQKLIQGQITEFDMIRNKQGFKAINLKVIGDIYDEEGDINYNK